MSLCLKRRREEAIILHTSDGPIRICVTDIVRNHAVEFAIDAPKTVRIARGELEELVTVAKRVLV